MLILSSFITENAFESEASKTEDFSGNKPGKNPSLSVLLVYQFSTVLSLAFLFKFSLKMYKLTTVCITMFFLS